MDNGGMLAPAANPTNSRAYSAVSPSGRRFYRALVVWWAAI
jgi:hypothetical protein